MHLCVSGVFLTASMETADSREVTMLPILTLAHVQRALSFSSLKCGHHDVCLSVCLSVISFSCT